MMFLYSQWRALPLATRVLIANQFGIAKIGTTHVIGNEIVSDGYKVEDVERALNVDAIQSYTGSVATDVNVLWDLMVAKVEGRMIVANVHAPDGSVQEAVISHENDGNLIVVPTKPKRKYTKKTK